MEDVKDKERSRDKRLQNTYGITLAQYNAILAAQDGKCAVCGRPATDFTVSLNVDHMHFKVETVRILTDYPTPELKWQAKVTLPWAFVVYAHKAKYKAIAEVKRQAMPLSIRGLLCPGRHGPAGTCCNRNLGRVDNISWLEKTLAYLKDPPARKVLDSKTDPWYNGWCEIGGEMTDSVVVSTVKKDLTWVASHIVLLLVVAGLIAGAVYFVDNIIEKHDAANDQKFEQILTIQTAQTKSLQQQLAVDQNLNAQRDAAYQKTIAQLSQSIVQRNANAQKQQAVDVTLDAVTAAQRITQQTQAQPGEVSVVGNTVGLDLPVARTVVSGLDSLVVSQANLTDTQKELTAQTALTADAKKEATDAGAVIAAQKAQLGDADKACDSKLAVLNRVKESQNLSGSLAEQGQWWGLWLRMRQDYNESSLARNARWS